MLLVSNSLDPGQDQHFVSPGLGPNCLQRLSADDKNQMIWIWVTNVGLRIQVSDSGPLCFIWILERWLAAPQIRVCNRKLFFFFLNQNINKKLCCGYSKEHPQHMFKLMGKKIITILC